MRRAFLSLLILLVGFQVFYLVAHAQGCPTVCVVIPETVTIHLVPRQIPGRAAETAIIHAFVKVRLPYGGDSFVTEGLQNGPCNGWRFRSYWSGDRLEGVAQSGNRDSRSRLALKNGVVLDDCRRVGVRLAFCTGEGL